MPSLLMWLAAMSLTAAFYVWRRRSIHFARSEALAFTAMYCFSLALALRFGGRTYPGIYFPDSATLNALLNGNFLFVGIGYALVLLIAVVDAMLILSARLTRRINIPLKGVKYGSLWLVVTIAIYGFSWAAIMGRLR